MRHWLITIAFVLGCGSRDRSERIAAIERCSAAYLEIAQAGLADTVAIYARGCSHLYREPSCHDVIAHLPDINPADRLVKMSRTCALAYCRVMADPLPDLCIPGASRLHGADLVAAWKQLDARILARELDLDPSSPIVARLGGAPFDEITVSVPRQPPPIDAAAEQQVTIERAGPSALRIKLDGHEWSVPEPPAAVDLDPMVKALDVHRSVMLATSPDITYASVIAVMDAIRKAGIADIMLSATTP